MVISSRNVVLVFILDKETDIDLELLAVNRGWRVVHATSVLQTLREICHLKPLVIIIQFSAHIAETLEVIEYLRQSLPQVPLIAVTSLNQEKIEQTIRSVGASGYFCGPGSTELVSRAVTMITARNTAEIMAK